MKEREKLCVIGLCGRSGAGKGFVSRIMAQLGIPSVDTDAVYRELTGKAENGDLSDCMKALVEAFGEGVLAADGSLDRRALGGVVFAEDGEEKRALLNKITHKFILEETDRRLAGFERQGAWAAVVDAPLLFESGYYEKCDFIVAAVAPEDVLTDRIIRRDNIDRDAALHRLAAQISGAELREKCDFVIDTDTDVETLSVRVSETISEIEKLGSVKGRTV